MWWLAMTLFAQSAQQDGAELELVHRVALLVGANHGPPGQRPLRFAEQDARNMAAVLQDTGRFDAGDVHVLVDPDPQQLLQAIDGDLQRLAERGPQTLFLFYYSGHADFEALYPNGQRLALAALKARLDSDRATVRIGIIDACRGGGWTQAKGFERVVPFDVSPQLRLVSEGSALLASSSGQEEAHETDALQGSYFTHHLVAALRGAGDHSTDGLVTLTEAFDYANRMTVRDTAVVAETPQHPSFDIKLHGRQDLVLSQLDASANLLDLDQNEGPLQVIQLSTGLVVLEVPAGKRTVRLAVPAGNYLVRRMGKEGTYAREIAIQAGTSNRLEEASLELSSPQAWGSKGREQVGAEHAPAQAQPDPGMQLELRVGGFVAPFDPYTMNLGLHLGFGLRFSPQLAWRAAELDLSGAIDKSLKRDLISTFAVQPVAFPTASHTVSSLLEWSPLRLSSADGSAGVEAGLLAGPTFVVITDGSEQFGLQLGLAIRLLLGSFTLEVDATDRIIGRIPLERTPSFLALGALRI